MPKSIVKSSQMSGEEEGARYISVKLPKELMDEIDRIVSTGTLGYRSRMEFIKDAVRDKILRLRSEISGGER
ncbi:MAG: ribbon-helix-helix domain-containing protein [Candidatus Bathyarchaeia archaeon]